MRRGSHCKAEGLPRVQATRLHRLAGRRVLSIEELVGQILQSIANAEDLDQAIRDGQAATGRRAVAPTFSVHLPRSQHARLKASADRLGVTMKRALGFVLAGADLLPKE